MTFGKEYIGDFMNHPIYHHSIHLTFEDYDRMLLKIRGRKPIRYDVYTSSNEPMRDYMLGFVIHWDVNETERISFKDFWNLLDTNWDWGYYAKKLGGYYTKPNGEWVKSYYTLDLKYSEVIFQTHTSGACPFNRITEQVSHFDIFGARDYLDRIKKA